MQEYTIHPVKTGEFKAIEKSNLMYQHDCGTKLVAPIIMYCIKGRDRVIVVDTGGSDEEWAEKWHHGLVRTPDMHPAEGLRRIGVDVRDVDTVINTHLHWDHSFNNEIFVNATFYVQKREIEYAVNPLPCHWVYYESWQLGLTPRWMRTYSRFKVLDGDYNLCPGIDLVTLPGHTPGFQGVLVQTARGPILIASDCMGLFESWTGTSLYKHVPSGIHYRLDEYYKSIDKMDTLCDFILPGHDPKVFDQEMYPILG